MLANWNNDTLKEIEQNAYFKWVDAGRPFGLSQKWWDLAEQEMVERTKLEEVVEITYKKPYRWKSSGPGGYVTVTGGAGISVGSVSGYHIELSDFSIQSNPCNEIPLSGPVFRENDFIDLSTVVNRGNNRYKSYDDARQKLSDELIKEVTKEIDRSISQYLGE